MLLHHKGSKLVSQKNYLVNSQTFENQDSQLDIVQRRVKRIREKIFQKKILKNANMIAKFVDTVFKRKFIALNFILENKNI